MSYGMLHCVVSYNLTDVSEALTASIITSESFVYFYQTTQHITPEVCHYHTRRRENLKSQ
jgi:hypothetical protein